MKTKIIYLTSLIAIIITLSSCNLFSPMNQFEKEIQNQYDYTVSIRKHLDLKITSVIEYPDRSRKHIDGMNIDEILSKDQMNRAIFIYYGDFKESEKRFKPVFMEEYRKWAGLPPENITPRANQ